MNAASQVPSGVLTSTFGLDDRQSCCRRRSSGGGDARGHRERYKIAPGHLTFERIIILFVSHLLPPLSEFIVFTAAIGDARRRPSPPRSMITAISSHTRLIPAGRHLRC